MDNFCKMLPKNAKKFGDFSQMLRSEHCKKHVNLVDFVKSLRTNIFLQNLASIPQRTSLIKFDHLVEKSE